MPPESAPPQDHEQPPALAASGYDDPMGMADFPSGDQPVDPYPVAAWKPLRTDAAGNVWEWEYRDGIGTRIVVGPVERAYILELQNRISNAVEVIGEFGSIDGAHHKQWVLDQVARHLLGDEYEPWAASSGDWDDWDVGIAP